MEPCRACCAACRQTGLVVQSPSTSSHDPYNLDNFLPAGLIVLKSLKPNNLLCDHTHATDGWHRYSGDITTNSDERDICSQLTFLTQHQFLAVTWCASAELSYIHLRIYIIPYDLPNVKGVLQRSRRGSALLKRAVSYMKAVVPRIVADGRAWGGSTETMNFDNFFVGPDLVRRCGSTLR